MESKEKPQRLGKLSLRPLKLDQALRAAMETGPPPELPKKKAAGPKGQPPKRGNQ